MTSLTVAVDTGSLHGHRTGVAVATAGLIDALGRRGDIELQPYLLSFRARPTPPQRRLPLPAGLAMHAWSATGRPRVDRWLGDSDVLHGTNYVAPPSRRPTVISVYDCWFLAHPDAASPSVRRAAHVLRRAVRRGARIHVSSHATADAARDLLDTDRISVVHLGPPPAVEHTERPATPTDEPPFLLALGTTERRKNLPTLVRAFGALADRHAELELVIAGAPGDDHAAIEAAISRLPAHHRRRVHTPGPVDAATKHRLLAHALALVYPSLDEGFGFPVLEAQATGTPVVATAVGSIPEVAGDGAELVRPGSDEALSVGIRRVVDDDERRAQLVTLGRRNLDRFSWDRCADEIVEVYRRAIEEQT